jgi:hypothetical protein
VTPPLHHQAQTSLSSCRLMIVGLIVLRQKSCEWRGPYTACPDQKGRWSAWMLLQPACMVSKLMAVIVMPCVGGAVIACVHACVCVCACVGECGTNCLPLGWPLAKWCVRRAATQQSRKQPLVSRCQARPMQTSRTPTPRIFAWGKSNAMQRHDSPRNNQPGRVCTAETELKLLLPGGPPSFQAAL